MCRYTWKQMLVVLSVLLWACTLGQTPQTPNAPDAPIAPSETAGAPPQPAPTTHTDLNAPDLIQPRHITYLGAFRLPADTQGSSWEYSGQGLTYNPRGDANGPDDGFPGSLFGFGHDQEMLVSEISIPAPVLSRHIEDLPVAQTLQPFQDVSGGAFAPQEVDLPRGGLAYLEDGERGHIYFAFGWHFQEFGNASHGRSSTDLSRPQAEGLWRFGEYSPYVTNDYLFAIPEPWASALGGYPLATGRAREGPWSGAGPALFAFRPPADDGNISAIVPLLLYGEQRPGEVEIAFREDQRMNGYQDADHWWGGAWLTAGERAAVVFVGTKALHRSWYGFANGVEWDYACAEQEPPTCPEVPAWPYDDRGYWAEGYQAQLIFYNPADLVAVARGEMASWEPQPYAVLDLNEYLFDPQIHVEDYKRDLVGAMAFDRENGLIYITERLADEARSVVHVFRIAP